MIYETEVQRLRADVAALATPAGRMVGGAGHARRGIFYINACRASAWSVTTERTVTRCPISPVGNSSSTSWASSPEPTGRRDPSCLARIMTASIDAPCADDNAAAVAITLAVAERLHSEQPARDVLVAFFDAEEPPYFLSHAMGSIQFVCDQMDARGVGCALIQDLTGHDVSLPLPMLGTATLPRIKDLVFALLDRPWR